MKLIATIPLHNEAWVCGLSLRVALMWCDEIVVLNHASTDETPDIVADVAREHPGRVHILTAPDAQWTEMQHRQMMLEAARAKGATHIAIVDADEILTGDLLPRSELLAVLLGNGIFELPGYRIFELPGYNLRGSLTRYHANGTWGNRWFSTAFKDDPRLYWFERSRFEEQFHHRVPFGKTLTHYRPIFQGRGGTMHLWGASERRLRAKHALYKVTERLRWPEKQVADIDRMYSWWKYGMSPGEPDNWQFADVPKSWWAPYKDWMKYLHLDAVPWQEQAVRELVAKHGLKTFAGLDLFGVG